MYYDYDFIIAGGGAAGLSLAYRLADPKFSKYKIALIDPELKAGNDHTWCSWLEGDHIFDDCAINFFTEAKIVGDDIDEYFSLDPLRYRMIKSSMFYDKVYQKIKACSHITFYKSQIGQIIPNKDGVVVELRDGQSLNSRKVFKSYIDNAHQIKQKTNLYLDQHFKGWFIKTLKPEFNVGKCVLMDFSIEQNDETRFMYVLPWSETEALVEVAIFSTIHLEQSDYDEIIKTYIDNQLSIEEYEVVGTEFGIIPMTDYHFKSDSEHVILLGTAGNGVKASTGFAFERIQRQCDQVVSDIEHARPINSDIFEMKFNIYDATLLNLLVNKELSGKAIFSRMFKRNKIQLILKFLDDRTSIWEDLKIMWSTQKFTFAKSFFKIILK
jgi:lycopene beta-cyclase